jgi:hypothetical protein
MPVRLKEAEALKKINPPFDIIKLICQSKIKSKGGLIQ